MFRKFIYKFIITFLTKSSNYTKELISKLNVFVKLRIYILKILLILYKNTTVARCNKEVTPFWSLNPTEHTNITIGLDVTDKLYLFRFWNWNIFSKFWKASSKPFSIRYCVAFTYLRQSVR